MADIERIPQNMAVSKDLLVGGKASVSGDAHVKGSLRVGGWLEADNIKGPMKGLFRTPAALKSEYPDPQPGWMALVGTTLPAPLYMEKDGEWTDTGNTAGTVVVGLSGIEERLAALESGLTEAQTDIAAVETGLTTANTRIQNLNPTVSNASYAAKYVQKQNHPGGPVTLGSDGFVPYTLLPDNLTDDVSDNVRSITALQDTVRQIQQNQDFDEGELNKLKQRVAALERISG